MVGYILSFIVQLLVSLKKGLQHVWAFSINDEVVKNIFALAIPLFISGVFFQIHRSVPSVLASLLQTGDIATLNYAFILITFLSIFIGGSIATVLYPSLTEEIVQLNKKRVDKLISYGVRMNSFVVIPLSFIIILLNKEIISLIYEHGAFTATQTEAVSLALTMYAIGLFAYSLDPLLSKILYALEKMKVRAVLMFVLMILTLVLGVIFMKPLGYAGLALASTNRKSVV